MQALFELLAGFIILLATACLSLFGVDLKATPRADREVHRISDCPPPPPSTLVVERPDARC